MHASLTTMVDANDAEAEFLGSEFEIGYSAGIGNWQFDEFQELLETELDRELTAHECELVYEGFAEGHSDREAYHADMQATPATR